MIEWMDTTMPITDGIGSKTEFYKVRSEQRSDLKIVPFNALRKDMGNSGSIRESLSVKWESGHERTEEIVAIGINPSTAQNGESDVTMTKLCRFLDMYGFNNVTMINLYESVSPDQDKINKTTKTAFDKKRELFDKADIILIVWGIAGHNEEKREAMSVLVEYADKLYCIKNTKGKYPAHPSRMSYKSSIIPISSSEDFISCGLRRRKNVIDKAVSVECDLSIFFNDKFLMSLDAGNFAVYNFAKLADEGIEGATEVIRSFNCNRDVYIPGNELLQFIDKEYPKCKERADKLVHNSSDIYKIVCYDLS